MDKMLYSKRFSREKTDTSQDLPLSVNGSARSADDAYIIPSDEDGYPFVPALTYYFQTAQAKAVSFAEENGFDIDIISHRIYNSIILYFPRDTVFTSMRLYKLNELLKVSDRLLFHVPDKDDSRFAIEMIYYLCGYAKQN